MEIETCLEEGDKYKKELKERLTYSKKLGISDGFERTSYLELLELNKKSSEKIEWRVIKNNKKQIKWKASKN